MHTHVQTYIKSTQSLSQEITNNDKFYPWVHLHRHVKLSQIPREEPLKHDKLGIRPAGWHAWCYLTRSSSLASLVVYFLISIIRIITSQIWGKQERNVTRVLCRAWLRRASPEHTITNTATKVIPLEVSLPKTMDTFIGSILVIEKMGFELTPQLLKGLIHCLYHMKDLAGY